VIARLRDVVDDQDSDLFGHLRSGSRSCWVVRSGGVRC
jgi:hypothetical protein